MIRSELVLRIAEQNPHLYAKDVEAMVSAILERIAEALVDGDRVELRGFGTFEARERDARSARNPKTGEAVAVGARAGVRFRPAKAMHDQLNRREVSPERAVDPLLRTS